MHVPGTVLVSGKTVVSKLIMVPASKELTVYWAGVGGWAEMTINKQTYKSL